MFTGITYCFLLFRSSHCVFYDTALEGQQLLPSPHFMKFKREEMHFQRCRCPTLILVVLQTSWKFILAFKDKCFDAKSFNLISSSLLSALVIMISWAPLLPCCSISWGLWYKPHGTYPQLSIHVHFRDCFFPACSSRLFIYTIHFGWSGRWP